MVVYSNSDGDIIVEGKLFLYELCIYKLSPGLYEQLAIKQFKTDTKLKNSGTTILKKKKDSVIMRAVDLLEAPIEYINTYCTIVPDKRKRKKKKKK